MDRRNLLVLVGAAPLLCWLPFQRKWRPLRPQFILNCYADARSVAITRPFWQAAFASSLDPDGTAMADFTFELCKDGAWHVTRRGRVWHNLSGRELAFKTRPSFHFCNDCILVEV